MRTFIASLFFVFVGMCNMQASKGYQIDLNVNGIPSGQIFLLASYSGTRSFVCDTAIINEKGVAIFEGKRKLPEGLYAIIFPDHQNFDILISEVQIFSVYTKMTNPALNSIITGAPESETYQKWQHESILFKQEKETSLAKLKEASDIDIKKDINLQFEKRKKLNILRVDSIAQSMPGTLVYNILNLYREPGSEIEVEGNVASFRKKHDFWVNHYWDYTTFDDERLLNAPALPDRISFFFNQLLPLQADSVNTKADTLLHHIKNGRIRRFVASQILAAYQAKNNTEAGKIFVHIADNWILNEGSALTSRDAYVTAIRRRTEQLRNSLPGMPAPDLNLLSREGSKKNLYSIESKYIALLFWDTDCPTCRSEAMKLDSVSRKKSGLTIVGVYVHADKVNWLNFVKQNNLSWIHLYDPVLQSHFEEKYHFCNVPALYLIDRNKKILAWNIKVSEIDKFIK